MIENVSKHGFGLVPEGTSNVDINVNMNEHAASAIKWVCGTALGVAIIIATPFVISLIKGRNPRFSANGTEVTL